MFGIITQVFSDNANHVRPDPLYQEILISKSPTGRALTVSASGIVGAISGPRWAAHPNNPNSRAN